MESNKSWVAPFLASFAKKPALTFVEGWEFLARSGIPLTRRKPIRQAADFSSGSRHAGKRKILESSPSLFCRPALERLHQDPDGLVTLVVEQGYSHIARVSFESEMKTEGAVQLPGRNPAAETPIELLNIRARSDLLEEVLAQNLRLGQAGKPRLESVVTENDALSVKLNNAVGK